MVLKNKNCRTFAEMGGLSISRATQIRFVLV